MGKCRSVFKWWWMRHSLMHGSLVNSLVRNLIWVMKGWKSEVWRGWYFLFFSFKDKCLYIPRAPTLFFFPPRQHQTEAVTKMASCDQKAKASSCTTTRCRTAPRRTRKAAGTRTPNQRRLTRIGSSRTERTIAPAPTLPVSSPAFCSDAFNWNCCFY